MTPTHVLLDIEGTTCPVNFVTETLFPYAKRNLQIFLQENAHVDEIRKLIHEAWDEWEQDRHPESDAMRSASIGERDDNNHESITQYLSLLIEIDRKSTALKDLQGKIWKEGYERGEIKTALFPETVSTLRRWQQQGKKLAVYSSGSVSAQKLLYQYTPKGDIRSWFCGWFDTHTGHKKEEVSYRLIAEKLGVPCTDILFISDNQAECDAAEAAGCRTLYSLRPGNPEQDPGSHPTITSLSDVCF